jgi:predicted ATPase
VQHDPQRGVNEGEPEVGAEAVRAALARLLGSRTFANAPVLRRFLQHVVERRVQERDNELKEYTLGVEAFDRGASFDPRIDTIVRVQARRLRAKLQEYYDREGRADPVQIVLAKGGYVPAFRLATLTRRPALTPGLDELSVRDRTWRSVPVPRKALIGRATELAGVKRLMRQDHVRLVTLTGPGGSGKTRLAVEVCRDLADEFPGGIGFVGLAPVSSTDAAIATIAHELGVRHTGGKPATEALEEHLQRSIFEPTLLFIDNVEHVIAVSPALGRLLDVCKPLWILVTSRAVLHLSGECEFPVAPLALPSPSDVGSIETLAANPAVALFLERAAAVRPDFVLTGDNAETVVEICTRLDGLPLAIELAAARVKMFTPSAIGARLGKSLDFLSRGPADAPLRHQDLRSTIDWSYRLLSPPEQRLFRRLSVFRGGCTLESIEAVCNPRRDLQVSVEDGLASLLDKSLVQRAESMGEPRFFLLETIREYASELLQDSGEADFTRRALAAYCLVIAEEGNRQLTDSQREVWLAACEAEHDNMCSALEWVVKRDDAEWGYRLVLALYAFWERCEYLAEGREWTEAVLGLPAAADRTWRRAKALAYAAAFATVQGDFENVRGLNHAAIDIFRELADAKGVIALLNALAVVERLQGNWAAAQTWHERSLAAAREAGDRAAAAAVLSNLADVVSAQGDELAARGLFEEALAEFRDLGEHRGIAWSLNHLGDVARAGGHNAEARRRYEEAAQAFRAQGDPWGAARTCADLGELASEQQDYPAALANFEEALQLFLTLGHRRGIATVLEGLATLFAQQRDMERVLMFAGAASALRQRIGAPARPREQAKIEQAIQSARALDSRWAEASWVRALKMTLPEVIAYARTAVRARAT